jgi:protein-S-isoprenylcysteine O-methyltransferase Ste14
MVIATCFYLIFFEERALSKRFKEEFKEYKENTNFLIHFPKKLIRGKVTDLTVGKKR